MGIGKLLDWGIMADAGLHLVVSATIFGISITTVINNHDKENLVVFGVGILVAALLQVFYHFGLLLRTFCAGKEEESSVGSILRNILTAVGLISSMACYAHIVHLKANMETWDGGDNWGITLSVVLFALMRVLDTIMNGAYKGWEYAKLMKHSCKDDEATILSGDEGTVLFTPRVVIVHILLGLCIAASSFDLSPDGGYLAPVEGAASTVNLIFALILSSLHFVLYPFALILNYCDCAGNICSDKGECKEGEGESQITRKELISLNRIPIVRSVVALVVLSCLSYAYGNLVGHAKTQLLLANLALYFAADQIGFDVI